MMRTESPEELWLTKNGRESSFASSITLKVIVHFSASMATQYKQND